MTLVTDYALTDRYTADSGTVFASGIQALARIPIEQLRRDSRKGMNTAAFVSGYPGSPLGGFDQEMARALRTVTDLAIVHRPGVNEELAAPAVMGSQLAATRPDATYDGVVGIWYGKAPGLDRGSDAIRHGNFAGSGRTSGAIALVGDDPGAKSSTMPNSSDATLVDLQMPVLYPGTIAECIELGLHGIAMSRASGLWTAMKIVTPIADGTGTVRLPTLDSDIVIPNIDIDGTLWHHTPSATFLGPRMVGAEKELRGVRTEMARRYGHANALNLRTVDNPNAWLGIVTTGYTHTQVIDALRRLGLSDTDAIAAAGIRVLNLRMPLPFDTESVRDFAHGIEEIVVIEEKNPTLERLVRDSLYGTSNQPVVVGKLDHTGGTLFPEFGHLDADAIIEPLRQRLLPRLADRLAPAPPRRRERIPVAVARTPYFCSGCPHNASTQVPDGSTLGVGTGCHAITFFMDEERVGENIGITAMGNEGSHWLGMEPFVETAHVFQNLGDGTYFHSGQLAVQAAIAAGANITFKLLYNHTVAMTGGQDAAHQIGPAELARTLLDHGVAKVTITTDDTSKYRDVLLPRAVEVIDRSRLLDVQRDLESVAGVTVMIHDQGCAAELRRRRKRGTVAAPTTRVVINHRICEGCGDCGAVSNCLSVQPIDTPLGRKTTIDQDSCNLDFSCLEGDCPAFMTIDVGDAERTPPRPIVTDEQHNTIPEPTTSAAPTSIRMTGIGGTGVVTAAHILATASLLCGLNADGLDQTGLSQKAGPVISDLVINPAGVQRRSNLIGEQDANLIIAFDELVALSDAALSAGRHGHTRVVASTSQTPTGAQVVDPRLRQPTTQDRADRLASCTDADAYISVDATTLANALTGTTATANTLLIGVVAQSGALPVSCDAIREAIRMNGVAVDANLAAFEWGRHYVHDAKHVAEIARRHTRDTHAVTAKPLSRHLERRIDALRGSHTVRDAVSLLAADLVEYQDSDYAQRFLDLVDLAAGIGDDELTETVARSFHKLLAYKDEYEVARLMTRPDGLGTARELTNDASAMSWHLHPPVLSSLGIDKKVKFGHRTAPLFKTLARGKRLRGTRLDPFGRTEMRRLERRLAEQYERSMSSILTNLSTTSPSAADLAEGTRIAGLADQVRGFEALKVRRATSYTEEFNIAASALSARLRNESTTP